MAGYKPKGFRGGFITFTSPYSLLKLYNYGVGYDWVAVLAKLTYINSI